MLPEAKYRGRLRNDFRDKDQIITGKKGLKLTPARKKVKKSSRCIMESFYSLKTSADILDISIRTLRRIIKSEEIKVYQVGKRIRLSETQIKSMIKERKSDKNILDLLLNI